MTKFFYKTTEMNGSNYVKKPLTSPTKLNMENDNIHCFLWSMLTSLEPPNSSHPNRIESFSMN